MLNVAIFSNHFIDTKGHGIARYVHQLYGATRRTVDDVHLIPVSSRKPEKKAAIGPMVREHGHHFLPWGRYATALSWGYLGRPFLEHWLGDPFDVVHAPNLGYPVPTKRPSVVTVHDVGPLMRPELFPRRSIRWMKIGFGHMVKNASAIICVSRATADEVISIGGLNLAKRIHVVHEGVEAVFSERPGMQCLRGIENLPATGTPFLLAVGAVSPRKNLVRIIDAIDKLKSDIPHQLVLVGGIGWDDALIQQRLRDQSVSNRIHFLGYVTEEQLRALYHSADAFVYPSLYEGFGLPILEAMAASCPVITSAVSSMPEIAGDAAVLVDPLDVNSIAAGIKEVCLDTHLAEELRVKGSQRAETFTWEKCAQGVATVYRQLVDP